MLYFQGGAIHCEMPDSSSHLIPHPSSYPFECPRYYAVHDPEFAPSLDVVIREVLPALEACRKAGKIRYIGITGYPLSALRHLGEHATVPVHTCISYSRYNLHDR